MRIKNHRFLNYTINLAFLFSMRFLIDKAVPDAELQNLKIQPEKQGGNLAWVWVSISRSLGGIGAWAKVGGQKKINIVLNKLQE